jgi:hypothetical protein
MSLQPLPRIVRLLTLASLFAVALPAAGVQAVDVLEITGDTVLDPARTYGRIVIKASNLMVDGRGAWLLGPAAAKTRPRPGDFQGVAIEARGVSNVRLRNVNARGWETGLKVSDSANWEIERCDFSHNFDDPAFGWGENSRRGGIILERVRSSKIRHCRANHVRDACVLVDSSDNTIMEGPPLDH